MNFYHQGYDPIYKLNSQGKEVVDFYFNSKGYRRPADDAFDYWSATRHPEKLSQIYYQVLNYFGNVGGFAPTDEQNVAVRCIVQN